MLFCGPSGLSEARPCPAVPVPLSARPGSVRLSCCFPSSPFPFPVGLCQALSLSQPQPGCFRPRVCLCQSPSVLSPVLAFPVRLSFRAPPPASPALGLTLPVPVPLSCNPSVPALVSSAPGLCPSVLAYPVLGVPCLSLSWSLGVPSLSWFVNVPCLVPVPGCRLSIHVPIPECPLSGPGPGPWVSPVHP